MATVTKNRQFTKPDYGDTADVSVLDANWELLDVENVTSDGGIEWEEKNSVSVHNGETMAVHGIGDTKHLARARQLATDPYTRDEPFPRWACTAQTLTDSTLFLTYLRPNADKFVSKFLIETFGTASVGATLAQMSLFLVNADMSLTSIATTVDLHTSLLVATPHFYSVSFGTPTGLTIYNGLNYAVGTLLVGQSTPAVVRGADVGVSGLVPQLSDFVSSQTTMPTTVAPGSLSATNVAIWQGVSA